MPIVVGGIGIGMIVVPVALSAIAGVGFDQIGPISAIALMLQNLGGPVVLAVIQAVITSRTLYLGGTNGPVKNMNAAQLHALDHGYTYGLLWVAGVAVIVGGASLLIGYTAQAGRSRAGSQGRPGRRRALARRFAPRASSEGRHSPLTTATAAIWRSSLTSS